MTIDEIQSALKFDMDMQLFDGMTGETKTKESLKYGNEMNYIHYCANEEAIELLEGLKELRNQPRCYLNSPCEYQNENINISNVEMKLIDSEKLLASMSTRYDEKKNIVPDTLAEGFMQMERLIKEQPATTEAEICRKFAENLKETFNQEFPSNYPSTKPYFTLENVRKLVDEVLAEMDKES